MLQVITDAYFQKYVRAFEGLAEKAVTSERYASMMREANRKAFHAAKNALGLAKRNDNRELMGTSLVQITRCHLVNAKFDKAIKSAVEAQELLHEVNDRKQEAMAMAYHAEALLALKKKEEAASIAERAHWLAKSSGNLVAEAYAAQVHNAVFAEERQIAQAQAPLLQVQDDSSVAAEAGQSVAVPEKKPALILQDVIDIIHKHALEATGGGDEEVFNDSSLMDAGMDSLSSVAFRNTLQRALPGINLPASLMFDYPTINQISDYVVEESSKW